MMIEELDSGKYEYCFRTIDSHTMGEATRIIVAGFPPLAGATMMERKQLLVSGFDRFRTALMLEPRGHSDMFGALLTEPIDPSADIGAIFMDTGGYLNMCGHGSMGVATVAVEARIVTVTEPVTSIRIETPAGIVRAEVKVENGKAGEVSIYNVPSFLYEKAKEIDVPGYGTVPFDIAFGGSFFALVDSGKIGIPLHRESAGRFVDLGMKLLDGINRTVRLKHPFLPIDTVDLAEFFGPSDTPGVLQKNVVVFGDGQFDRSPCGTGTSAKIAELYAAGELRLGEEIANESITGMAFRGTAVEEARVGDFPAVIPRITGRAWITGDNKWLIGRDDPFGYGFLIHGGV
jgi:proline racemase/trans-L-3-hydroxyproline dehydratase